MSIRHLMIALVGLSLMGNAQAAQPMVLENARLLSWEQGGFVEVRYLVIEDGRIVAIGDELPEDLDAPLRREMKGKYVVPGLIDMHVHLFSRDELPFYSRYGITSVRNMWGWDDHLKWAASVENGELEGPRIFTTGPIIDGDPPQLRGSTVLTDSADAETIVKSQIQAGFDFIKVYDGIGTDPYAALILAARKHGIDVVGHVPAAVGIYGAIGMGQRTLEHLRGFASAVIDGEKWNGRFDRSRAMALSRAIADSGIAVVPTLVTLKRGEMSAAESKAILSLPVIQELPELYRRFCCSEPYDPSDDLPAEEQSLRLENRERMVRSLNDAGVRILIGSDTGNAFVIPGLSYHEEIELLSAAGFPALEILRASSLEAAKVLGKTATLGRIEEGFNADLVILDANPLEDIAALKDPVAVFVGGRPVYERSNAAAASPPPRAHHRLVSLPGGGALLIGGGTGRKPITPSFASARSPRSSDRAASRGPNSSRSATSLSGLEIESSRAGCCCL